MWYKILLAVLFGVLEGVTEWLPVSSTGHLILLRHFVRFPVRDSFFELFEVVIQLGAILAVILLFFDKLCPFGGKKSSLEKKQAWALWGRVAIAALPAAVIGLLLDDLLDAYLFRVEVVASTLILYGIFFVRSKRLAPRNAGQGMPSKRGALLIGGFQVLSLIPGTSRSGATILGGLAAKLSRQEAAEFSFFLAIPTMLGASLLKTVKFFGEGNMLNAEEIQLLLVGTLAACLVSLLSIRTLLSLVQRHSFAGFGVYRIALGILVLLSLFF